MIARGFSDGRGGQDAGLGEGGGGGTHALDADGATEDEVESCARVSHVSQDCVRAVRQELHPLEAKCHELLPVRRVEPGDHWHPVELGCACGGVSSEASSSKLVGLFSVI